jgi:hypothetical protein
LDIPKADMVATPNNPAGTAILPIRPRLVIIPERHSLREDKVAAWGLQVLRR